MNAASVVVELCDLLDAGETDRARRLARERIPSAPATTIAFPVAAGAQGVGGSGPDRVRGLTESERTWVCYRDGFVDRLSPERFRLVYPGALRVLSLLLDGALDTHVTNGTVRSYACNSPLWWDLWPTVDHLTARANGGANDPDNLACVSWWRNAAKGATPLELTGWALQEGGDPEVWDGLLGWFVTQVHRRPELGQDAMVRAYLRAADGLGGHRVDPALLATPSTASSRAQAGPQERADVVPPERPARQQPRVAGTTARCTKDVWARNTRGAYHSHRRQGPPTIWEAGNGRWRVVETGGRSKWTLERRLDGDDWRFHSSGSSSDALLADAASADLRDGVPARLGPRPCWFPDRAPTDRD